MDICPLEETQIYRFQNKETQDEKTPRKETNASNNQAGKAFESSSFVGEEEEAAEEELRILAVRVERAGDGGVGWKGENQVK